MSAPFPGAGALPAPGEGWATVACAWARRAAGAGAAQQRAADMAGAPRSLRAHLARSLLVPLLCVLPLAAWLQYSFVLKPAMQAFDHGLGDSALALGNLIRQEAGAPARLDINPETEHALRTNQSDRLFYAVLAPDGALLAGDTPLGTLVLPAPAVGRAAFRDARLGDTHVRVVAMGVKCGGAPCEVRVAETLNKRRAARRDAFLAVLVPMLLLALALLAVILTGIHRGLLPLQALRAELSERSLERLDPISAPAALAEAQPLIDALNRLFERLRRSAELQKTFIAAAAHQLRTPLTSLRTEAELALLEPHPPSLTPTLSRLALASERAARLAAQLLSLARAGSAETDPRQRTDLKQVANDEAEEWVRQASQRGADLGFELAPAPVLGRPMLLREMIGNLVHNALEYAGDAAHVTVRTRQDTAGRSLLEVEDDGPGIAPNQRDAVLQRFHRGPDAPGRGSGLGLSIVRDIARDHGGHITLADARPGATRPGLRVQLTFPAPAGTGAPD